MEDKYKGYKLSMEIGEIKREYAEAKNQNHQYTILCHRNPSCPKEIIAEIAGHKIKNTRRGGRESKFPRDLAAMYYEQGLNDREISEKIGFCVNVVNKWRHDTNRPNNSRCGKFPKDLAAKYYEQGLSDKQIAEKIGFAINTVGKWRRDTNRPSNGRGSNFPKALAAKYYRQGLNDREIGEKTGFSANVVNRWRHDTKRPSNGRSSVKRKIS